MCDLKHILEVEIQIKTIDFLNVSVLNHLLMTIIKQQMTTLKAQTYCKDDVHCCKGLGSKKYLVYCY